ncbi:hypothetical protein WJX81_001678 [Elliptochloris bilobata]|uniref:Uncharacterized protein n=1 Tax=Elliptochloris bilobata TaxID=381761 RepID=A0AAW1RWG2_9CHLO
MPNYTQEQAVAFLQKVESQDGSSVYDHLARVVLRILEEQPSDAVDLLETTPELPIDPDTGLPVGSEAPNTCQCADVTGEAALLAAVGAGLGAREAATAALAVHALGADAALGAASARFWGKLLGVHADYYVFEAALRPPDDAAGEEAAGGAAFFVCNRLGGPLARLPPAEPRHIAGAQRVKRFLTGRLDAPVVGVRSVLWPGAVAVAAPGAAKHACSYMGWGVKAAPFLPPPPPPVPDEYSAELVESAELPLFKPPEPAAPEDAAEEEA